MAEIKSQQARRELVLAVAEYDDTVVTKNALDDSSEFNAFLAKPVHGDRIDSLDAIEIIVDVEERLDIDIPDEPFETWQQVFDRLVQILNEE